MASRRKRVMHWKGVKQAPASALPALKRAAWNDTYYNRNSPKTEDEKQQEKRRTK